MSKNLKAFLLSFNIISRIVIIQVNTITLFLIINLKWKKSNNNRTVLKWNRNWIHSMIIMKIINNFKNMISVKINKIKTIIIKQWRTIFNVEQINNNFSDSKN